MNIVTIIEKKKLMEPLTHDEIDFFVNGSVSGSIPDYQISAMLMAIRLNGMNRAETAALTLSMVNSGETVDLSALSGIPTDKHSTGGVGDTTTLILAPLVAACGVPVAKMSGRGLGHTGGTLDKLESIKGFRTGLDVDQFISQVKSVGCAVIGQSSDLTPADKAFYAMRDVTSTIDSLPLIASSIMCKKIASGTKAIVLDVKTGDGAIMRSLDESVELAAAMVRIGEDMGRRTVALVTDMDEPLGSHVGNALEVKEAIDVLAGHAKGPLLEVSLELGRYMLQLGGAAESKDSALNMLRHALDSGRGLETLARIIQAQGGDAKVCGDVTRLPKARIICDVPAIFSGYVHHMNTAELGYTAQALGAGRKTKADVIDHSVGFVLHKRIGDPIQESETLATVHAGDEESAAIAIQRIQQAIHIGPEQVPPRKLIHAYVTGDHTDWL